MANGLVFLTGYEMEICNPVTLKTRLMVTQGHWKRNQQQNCRWIPNDRTKVWMAQRRVHVMESRMNDCAWRNTSYRQHTVYHQQSLLLNSIHRVSEYYMSRLTVYIISAVDRQGMWYMLGVALVQATLSCLPGDPSLSSTAACFRQETSYRKQIARSCAQNTSRRSIVMPLPWNLG